MIEIVKDPSRRVLRQFSVAWAIVSGAAGLSFLLSGSEGAPVAAAAGCAALGVAGIVHPPAARPIFLAMSYMAFPVGHAVSQIVLAFIYFAVVTPVGLLMRITGRDPLQLRSGRGAASGWKMRGGPTPPEQYVRQY